MWKLREDAILSGLSLREYLKERETFASRKVPIKGEKPGVSARSCLSASESQPSSSVPASGLAGERDLADKRSLNGG